MHAIVLAAGLGRRMSPLTANAHKALLPVGGTTILGRIVDSLHARGVDDVTIVTGWRAEDLQAFLSARYPGRTFRYVHNARYAETNNIVSLALALGHCPFERDVLLFECDLLFDPSVLDALFAPGGGNVALVDAWRPGMDGTVVSAVDGFVTEIFPSHRQGPSFDFAGKLKTLNLYRFDRDFCRDTFRPLVKVYADQIDASCFYELVLGMIVGMPGQRVRAERVDGSRWIEVDDPNDLAAARFTFEPQRRGEVLDRALGGLWNLEVLDFAWMRNAHFPTDAMLATMRHALPALVGGYGSAQPVLDEKLGWLLGCRPERVVTLAGAAQVFPFLEALVFAHGTAGGRRAGDVFVPEPTFGEFSRAFPGARTYADRPGIDTAALEADAADAACVVFVNPNSPSGTTLSTEWLHRFAAVRPGVRVIVDESFVDFSDEEPLWRRLERDPLPNVLVLASLSKVLGAPGLRVGFAYTSDPALRGALLARLPVWNVSAPAEFLLELTLKFRPELAASLARTRAERAAFAAALAALPAVARVYPSGGNFLLVELVGDDPGRAARLRQRLLVERRFHVKDVSSRFAPKAPRLRLAVRSAADNLQLVAALAASWEGA